MLTAIIAKNIAIIVLMWFGIVLLIIKTVEAYAKISRGNTVNYEFIVELITVICAVLTLYNL